MATIKYNELFLIYIFSLWWYRQAALISKSKVANRNTEASAEDTGFFPPLSLPALMTGAFLLPTLSPEDGIPVVLCCTALWWVLHWCFPAQLYPFYSSLLPVFNHGMLPFAMGLVLSFVFFLCSSGIFFCSLLAYVLRCCGWVGFLTTPHLLLFLWTAYYWWGEMKNME